MTIAVIDAIEAYIRGDRTARHVEAMLAALSMDEIYDVQFAIHGRRERAGDLTAGYKMAVTGRALQHRLGLDGAVYGAVPASRILASGACWPHDGGPLLIEAELALLVAGDMAGSLLDRDAACAAIALVRPAIEIITDASDAPDAMPSPRLIAACGKSEGAFVLGAPLPDGAARALMADASRFEARISVDGEQRMAGRHPVGIDLPDLLMSLSAELAKQGRCLRGGDIVMTGSIFAPIALAANASLLELDLAALSQVRVGLSRHHSASGYTGTG